MFLSCWSRSLQIHFWAVILRCSVRQVELQCSPWKRSCWVFLCQTVNQWWCSVVLSGTHFAGLQSTPRLALPLAPSHLWKCWQWALVSLRHCFYKATSRDSLKSGSWTAEVVHLNLLETQWRQLRPWPSPGPMCACPQSPQLLRPELSQPWEHLLSTQMSCRHWIYKTSRGGVDLQLMQPRGEISALFPKPWRPWDSAVVFSPDCLWATHWHLIPEPPEAAVGCGRPEVAAVVQRPAEMVAVFWEPTEVVAGASGSSRAPGGRG